MARTIDWNKKAVKLLSKFVRLKDTIIGAGTMIRKRKQNIYYRGIMKKE
jgi:hypothetical protein